MVKEHHRIIIEKLLSYITQLIIRKGITADHSGTTQDCTLTGIIRNLPEKQNGSPSFGKLSSESIKNTDLSVKSLLTEWTGKSFCKKFPYPQSTESKRKKMVCGCGCVHGCARTHKKTAILNQQSINL